VAGLDRWNGGAAWFRPRRLPGRLGAVGVTRLLVFQLVLAGVLLTLVWDDRAAVLGGAVGAVAMVAVAGRWRGRWLTEHAAIWVGYRRRRGVAGTYRDDPRLVALGELAPDLEVADIDGADPSARWGMASDDGGWFAVLEVVTAGSAIHPPLPLAALVRVADEAEQWGVVIQVVSHTVPAGVPPGTVGYRNRPVLWVAVRLDAGAVAESMVDDPESELDVPAVLAEITRRARRVLRRRGLPTRLLDADGVVDALVRSCDLAPAYPARPGHEEWDAWHSRRFAHRCYWLRVWPDREYGTDLLAHLGALPDAEVSIALVLAPRPEHEGADLRCLVRVAVPPDRYRATGDHAERLVTHLGGRLLPLNGEHALAVYGSAPTGGGSL
jgi:type VII secretion protein EccE